MLGRARLMDRDDGPLALSHAECAELEEQPTAIELGALSYLPSGRYGRISLTPSKPSGYSRVLLLVMPTWYRDAPQAWLCAPVLSLACSARQ